LACTIEIFACILVFVVFVLPSFPTFLWIMSVFLAVVVDRYVLVFRLVTASSGLILAILCELASEVVVDEV
jgi:hypothetical protein